MRIPVIEAPEAAFDLSPMIDMVFLLLIFFMIASRFSVQQNIELEIPVADKAAVPEERHDRFTVNILKDGSICIYGNDIPVPEDTLREAFRKEKTEAPATKVYLRADQDAEFVHVRKVMSILAEEGYDASVFGAFVPN